MRCNNGVMFQTGHQPQGHTVMMTKINCSMIMMIIMMMVMNMMTKDDNKYDKDGGNVGGGDNQHDSLS